MGLAVLGSAPTLQWLLPFPLLLSFPPPVFFRVGVGGLASPVFLNKLILTSLSAL